MPGSLTISSPSLLALFVSILIATNIGLLFGIGASTTMVTVHLLATRPVSQQRTQIVELLLPYTSLNSFLPESVGIDNSLTIVLSVIESVIKSSLIYSILVSSESS